MPASSTGFLSGAVAVPASPPKSIYTLLSTMDTVTVWPKSARFVLLAVSAVTVILTDSTGGGAASAGSAGAHGGVPLNTIPLLLSAGAYQNVYLDQMFVHGAGTEILTIAIWT